MSNHETPATPGSGRSGSIAVSPQAVATIARAALLECYGIAALTGSQTRARRLLRRRVVEPFAGIEVEIDGETMVITLHVVVTYGTPIAEVARNVMQTVGYAVEQAVGRPVTAVNVHVDGLQLPHEPEGQSPTG